MQASNFKEWWISQPVVKANHETFQKCWNDAQDALLRDMSSWSVLSLSRQIEQYHKTKDN